MVSAAKDNGLKRPCLAWRLKRGYTSDKDLLNAKISHGGHGGYTYSRKVEINNICFYKIKDAAKFYKKTPSTMSRWVKRGIIKHIV